jgi:four helix bundle protein
MWPASESASASASVLAFGMAQPRDAGWHHPISRFQVLDVAIHAIEVLRPTVARIRRYDRDLGEQLRSALSSIALNVAEGNRSQGGHRIARFSTAAGSNSESRAALRVAVAWGYVEPLDIEAGDRLLDRVAAMLHRLGARQ